MPVRSGVEIRMQRIKMGTLKRAVSDWRQHESSEDRNAINEIIKKNIYMHFIVLTFLSCAHMHVCECLIPLPVFGPPVAYQLSLY
jgi:hypothetical protein